MNEPDFLRGRCADPLKNMETAKGMSLQQVHDNVFLRQIGPWELVLERLLYDSAGFPSAGNQVQFSRLWRINYCYDVGKELFLKLSDDFKQTTVLSVFPLRRASTTKSKREKKKARLSDTELFEKF